jgi:hypothetical protein
MNPVITTVSGLKVTVTPEGLFAQHPKLEDELLDALLLDCDELEEEDELELLLELLCELELLDQLLLDDQELLELQELDDHELELHELELPDEELPEEPLLEEPELDGELPLLLDHEELLVELPDDELQEDPLLELALGDDDPLPLELESHDEELDELPDEPLVELADALLDDDAGIMVMSRPVKTRAGGFDPFPALCQLRNSLWGGFVKNHFQMTPKASRARRWTQIEFLKREGFRPRSQSFCLRS